MPYTPALDAIEALAREAGIVEPLEVELTVEERQTRPQGDDRAALAAWHLRRVAAWANRLVAELDGHRCPVCSTSWTVPVPTCPSCGATIEARA